MVRFDYMVVRKISMSGSGHPLPCAEDTIAMRYSVVGLNSNMGLQEVKSRLEKRAIALFHLEPTARPGSLRWVYMWVGKKVVDIVNDNSWYASPEWLDEGELRFCYADEESDVQARRSGGSGAGACVVQ